MSFRPPSSRRRFEAYWRARKSAPRGPAPLGSSRSGSTVPATPPSGRSFVRLLIEFWKLLAEHRTRVVFALATLTAATALHLVPPAATKIAVDYILPHRPLPEQLTQWMPIPADPEQQLTLLVVAVLSIGLLASFLRLWGRWHATLATKRMQSSMRRHVFEHAVRLPLNRVYQLKSGGVASILREDAGGIGELIFSMLYNPWRAIIQLLGSLAILAWVDWRLLLGSLVLIPMVFLTHRAWIRRIRPLHRDIRGLRQDIDSHATEAFGGMRIVRAFGRDRSETGRFTRGNHFMARQELRAWWWSRTVDLVWEIVIPLSSAALLLYGGTQVLRGTITLGDLTMFLFYLTMLLGPLSVLADSATQLQNSLAGLDRVLDLVAEPREMPRPANAITVHPQQVTGRVTLDHVSFRYPGNDELVLDDVSLDVLPGQMVALVGPSGAGKTTLCNLVARFYDPTSGRIMLDGVDLRAIDVDSYRRLLGIVEQDIFLFDGTVAENIGYATRTARQEDIEQAARVANAHDFIRALPSGYDTIIGERGVRLSGGQRQRLAIARAVLADPRILILDEATSNLDTESERLIQKSLGTLMRGRTSFVIAHRLSTIVHADRIVVLEGGRIVESGSHDELLARSARYHQMVQVQLGGERPLHTSSEANGQDG